MQMINVVQFCQSNIYVKEQSKKQKRWLLFKHINQHPFSVSYDTLMESEYPWWVQDFFLPITDVLISVSYYLECKYY